jgi:hypothetical protein
LVNRQFLLFTKPWRHSKFASSLCKIRGEKHYTDFVKVVEGSEIYNFPIHHFVHFYSKFLRKMQSNRGTPSSLARARAEPRPRRTAPRPHRLRTPPPRPLLPHDRAHTQNASCSVSPYCPRSNPQSHGCRPAASPPPPRCHRPSTSRCQAHASTIKELPPLASHAEPPAAACARRRR